MVSKPMISAHSVTILMFIFCSFVNINFIAFCKLFGVVYSKWSYAFLDLRSSECTCARKSTCFVSKII